MCVLSDEGNQAKRWNKQSPSVKRFRHGDRDGKRPTPLVEVIVDAGQWIKCSCALCRQWAGCQRFTYRQPKMARWKQRCKTFSESRECFRSVDLLYNFSSASQIGQEFLLPNHLSTEFWKHSNTPCPVLALTSPPQKTSNSPSKFSLYFSASALPSSSLMTLSSSKSHIYSQLTL